MHAVKASRIMVLCILGVLLFGEARAGSPGDAGALVLRAGVGARASGMGEAFIAVGEDASSVFWNPGAMAAVLGTNGILMHHEYFMSTRLEQAALTHETDFGTLGFAFTGFYTDELDRYENVPTSSSLGTFPVYDVTVTVAFSRYVLPNLAAGVALKPIYERIDDTSARGMAFDVGLYHVSRIPGLKMAAVIANLGAPMKFVSEKFALPRVIKVGGSYQREVPSARGDVLLTLDLLFPNDGELKEHLGFEYSYSRRLYLRAGYKSGYDSYGATFGAGFALGNIQVDYAIMLISNDLGDSHRFSLAFGL